MTFAFDHHYSPRIAEGLRAGGIEAVTAFEHGWHTCTDEELLARCHDEGFILVTNNIADFTIVIREWALQGRTHAGIVFTSDSTLPRTRSSTGRFVTALAALVNRYPQGMVDRVHWLNPAAD